MIDNALKSPFAKSPFAIDLQYADYSWMERVLIEGFFGNYAQQRNGQLRWYRGAPFGLKVTQVRRP